MNWMPVLLLGATQIAPVGAPPGDVAIATTRISIDVREAPLPVGARYAYTVRYLSTADDELPIVRLDLGTASAAGPGAFTSPPIDVRSPEGWRAVVTSDDTAGRHALARLLVVRLGGMGRAAALPDPAGPDARRASRSTSRGGRHVRVAAVQHDARGGTMTRAPRAVERARPRVRIRGLARPDFPDLAAEFAAALAKFARWQAARPPGPSMKGRRWTCPEIRWCSAGSLARR